MNGWDEAWDASSAALRSGRKRRRPVGIWLVFAVVLGLVVLMVAVTHRGRAPGVSANDLIAGPGDHDSGYFIPCAGPTRATCVLDGQTVWYQGTRLRIADIDAPRILSAPCDGERDMGGKAARRLLALLNAGAFAVEGTGLSAHGHALRRITRGGVSIGAVLASEGLADGKGHRRDWCR